MAYPASTFSEAVDLAITSANQLHEVINGESTETVTVESGTIPSLRKALVDNFYFVSPLDWVVSSDETVFNQLRTFTDGSVWYAPSARVSNPITMTADPYTDSNWFVAPIAGNFYIDQKVNTGDSQISGAKIWPEDSTKNAALTDTIPADTLIIRLANALYELNSPVPSDGSLTAFDTVAGTATIGGTQYYISGITYDIQTLDALKVSDYPVGSFVKTKSYSGGWQATVDGIPRGNATYLIMDATKYGSTPDGYGDHYINSGTDKVARLFHRGKADLYQFGGDTSSSQNHEFMDAAFSYMSNCQLTIPEGDWTIGDTRPTISNPIKVILTANTKLIQTRTDRGVLIVEDTDNVQIIGQKSVVEHVRTIAGANTLYVEGSSRVTIQSIKFENSPKDMVYLGDSTQFPGNKNNNVKVLDCEFTLARRQGISIIHGRKIDIDLCTFWNISGESPSAGIDLESNTKFQEVFDVSITRCHFFDMTQQAGIIVATAKKAMISKCTFEDSLGGITVASVSACTDSFEITNVNPATDEFTLTGHTFKKGDRVDFTEVGGGTLPTGISSGSVYRIYTTTANTFTVSTYYDALPIDITTTGTLPIQVRKFRSLDKNVDITIDDCDFDSITANAIFADVATDLKIKNIRIRNNQSLLAALLLNNVDDSTIQGVNCLEATAGEGIFVSGIRNTIQNNKVYRTPDEGLRHYGGYQSKILNNIFLSCGLNSTQAGDFRYTSDSEFINNTVKDEDSLGVIIGWNMRGVDSQRNLLRDNNMTGSSTTNANSLSNVHASTKIDISNILNDGTPYTAHMSANASQFTNVANDINQFDKYINKSRKVNGTNRQVFATGSLPTDTWVDAQGVVVYTPV